jgi:hypothetical protein
MQLLYIIKVIRDMNLTNALRGNAVFTAACAFACLALTGPVTSHAAIPDRLWTIGLGVMLALYVPILLFAAARPVAWLVRTIIVLDWGYVAIATGFFLTHFSSADGAGNALMILSTALVALFAWLQMRGLAAMQQEVTR